MAADDLCPDDDCATLPLTAEEARQTFAHRLGAVADRIRGIATRLGARPYRVFFVYTKFTGEERGAGAEVEISRTEILPTPLVSSLDNIALRASEAGIIRMGSLRLTGVSTSYTQDQLEGRMTPEEHTADTRQPYRFFYEVVEDGRGDPNPTRGKYRLLTTPMRRATQADWSFSLEKIDADRPREVLP
jgi:hypothetical protein